jgi:voltage-gated potassium channel Kch
MSQGLWALVTWHLMMALATVVAIAIFIALTGLAPVEDGAEPHTFVGLIWLTLMHAIDPGTVTGAEGGYAWLGILMFTTVAGILLVGSLVAVLVSNVAQRFEDLRQGRSRVIESDHTLVVGWSRQIFTIVQELAVANESRGRSCIVVFADHDKIWMDDELRAKVPNTKTTRVVVRSGDPTDPGALDVVNPQDARAIVVLAPEGARDDTQVVRALLAVGRSRPAEGRTQHVVTEIRDPRNVAVARLTSDRRTEVLEVGDLIAKIAVQTCLQSGLSVVYDELLGFDGDEIYFVDARPLAGRTFGEALHDFDDCTVLGLRMTGGRVQLKPPLDQKIQPNDKLIVIAADDDRIRVVPWSGSAAGKAADDVRATGARAERHRERILILGWNARVPAIVSGIDAYVVEGSEIVVVTQDPDVPEAIAALATTTARLQLSHHRGDFSDRRVVDTLNPKSWDHVMVLPEDRVEDATQADAQVLVALLHLRDVAEGMARPFTIVSEMRDVRSRDLAEVARADDFIVSDRLVGLLLSQIAENADLAAVFADLFDPDGAEIYLRPAGDYVQLGRELDMHALIAAARARGDVALGYRRAKSALDPAANFGVVLNPRKRERFTLEAGDRVIVLAE